MQAITHGAQRHAKGSNFIELVKTLRVERHKRTLQLSPTIDSILEERILPTAWYPHATFVELLLATNHVFFGGTEQAALKMGVVGARAALLSTHKAYIRVGDPQASVLALRHSWRTFFDFGSLRAEADGACAVTFTLTGYQDVTPTHAMVIAAWGIAASELAGAGQGHADVFDRPWLGAAALRYRIRF